MLIKYINYSVMVILGFALFFLIWLVVQNRTSEKLVTSVLIIALLTTSATIIAGLYALKEENIEVWFRKVFVFDKVTKQQPMDPLGKPYINPFFGKDDMLSTAFFLSRAVEKDPELTRVVDSKGENIKLEEVGRKLYKDILYSEIVSTIFSKCHWKAHVKRYTGPGWASISYGPPKDKNELKPIKWERITEMVPNNNLLEFEDRIHHQFFYVPKTIRITATDEEFSLKDSFVSITISIKPAGGSLGANQSAPLLGLTFYENYGYYTQGYEIKINAKFTTLKQGHPKMKDYHDWVDHIISELRYNYDSARLLKEAKEAFLYHNMLPNSPKLTTEEKFKEQEKYRKWLDELREKQRKELPLSSQK